MRSRHILVLVAGLLACTNERQATAPGSTDALSRRQRPSYGWNGYNTEQRAAPAPAALAVTVDGTAADLPPVTPADISSMVIRTAEAALEVDSLEPAIARVRELAAQLGGYIASTEITSGNTQLRSARLEVKIPAPRFDASLSGLAPIGKLESVSVTAEDVGEQFVDVTARMDNARRLERRLIDLLANRTGKLKDVLDVEQSLARVREEIERYEGRIRYLRAHTATSTLSVYVHEPVPVVGSAGHSVIADAFRQSWRNFVALASFAVQSLGVVVPLGAVAALAWVLARRWRRVINQPTA